MESRLYKVSSAFLFVAPSIYVTTNAIALPAIVISFVTRIFCSPDLLPEGYLQPEAPSPYSQRPCSKSFAAGSSDGVAHFSGGLISVHGKGANH